MGRVRRFTEQEPSRWWQRALRVVGLALFWGLVGLAGWNVYLFVRTSPHFELSHVEVTGNRALSQEEILARMGVRLGRPLMDVDVALARDALESHPLVRRARVRPVPPDTLEVEIDEYHPVAVLRVSDAHAAWLSAFPWSMVPRGWMVDDHGVMFAPHQETLGSWPAIELGEGGAASREVLGAAVGILQALSASDVVEAALGRVMRLRPTPVYVEVHTSGGGRGSPVVLVELEPGQGVDPGVAVALLERALVELPGDFPAAGLITVSPGDERVAVSPAGVAAGTPDG